MSLARNLHLRLPLVGKTGVGKSSVARALATNHGFGVLSTGSVCRSVCRLLFGDEDKGNTQRLDDALTRVDPSIFLNAVLRGADLSGPVVVDSARFRSDVAILRAAGFSLLRVTAAIDVRRERLVKRSQQFDFEVQGAHRSETELDDEPVDFAVDNGADLETLGHQVADIFQQ